MDACFTQTPLPTKQDSGQRTGVSSVGHELWEGVRCRFRAAYYDEVKSSAGLLNSSCTIQSKRVIMYWYTMHAVCFTFCLGL